MSVRYDRVTRECKEFLGTNVFKNRVVRRLSLTVVPPCYVAMSKLWFATCRLTIRDSHHIDDARELGAVIVPFWHYSLSYIFHHLKQYPGIALVSASEDGDYIARVAELLNFDTARGSSNRRGMPALKKTLKAMKQGRHVGIVADGSQGPPRRCQPGAVFLASRTGAPILPVVWSCDRFITFNSWDRMVLPSPFSRIVLRYGKPYTLARGLDADGIERERLLLEKRLNILYHQVWAEFDRKHTDNGPDHEEKNEKKS